MKNSRIDFSQQEEELKSRVGYFNVYWKGIESKLDPNQNERMSVDQLEQIIKSLWVYRIKFPALEKHLERYFECKEVQVAMKYFLTRFNQLENERFRLFAQDTDQNKLNSIVESLREISLVMGKPSEEKNSGVEAQR